MNPITVPDLTPADWVEIYYAIETKEKLLAEGVYGKDKESRRWRRHLARIRQVIVAAGIEV